MNKWVVVLLVGLAMLVLVSPGIIGRLAERDLNDSIEIASVESPEITVTTERFIRGWFTTEGRHRVELTDRTSFPVVARFVGAAGLPNMPAVIISSHMDHGLVALGTLFDEQSSLTPGVASMVSTLQLDPGDGLLVDIPGKIATHIALNGSTHLDVNLVDGNWTRDEASIKWGGADLDMVVDSAGAVNRVQGYIAPLWLSAGEDQLTTSRLDINIDQKTESHGLKVGSIAVKSGPLAVRHATPELPGLPEFPGLSALPEAAAVRKSVGFEALSFEASNDVRKGRVSASSSTNIDGILLPGFGLVDLGVDVALDGFDAPPFVEIFRAWEEAAADVGPLGAFEEIYPAHEEALQRLLSGGGEIRIDRLDLALPMGAFASHIRFSLPRTDGREAPSLPGVLLKLQATIKLRMSATVFDALVEQQPDARGAVAAGFLIKDGDDYKMTVEVAKGLATVNGAPMSLPILPMSKN